MNDKQKRVILVVWKWGEDPDFGVQGPDWDQWQTETGDSLIRMDVREEDWQLVSDVAKRFWEWPVLLLLHDSTPNFFNLKKRASISAELEKENISFRIVPFSGGREPIYYAYNEWGVLGLDGCFPYRPIELPDGSMGNLSNFILDYTRRRINRENFDFIWDFYWNGRRSRILELSEELRIWAFGYHSRTEKKADVLESLKAHATLWEGLHTFTGNPDVGYVREYDMQPYLLYLETKKETAGVASRLKELQGSVRSFLSPSSPVEPKPDRAIVELYNQMIDLFEALPEDTL